MAKRPIMCNKPAVYVPDDDCSECMIEVNKLRREVEECCDEVKGTLSDHDGRITTNANNIATLQNTATNHEGRITSLEDCCNEVRPQIQSINNRFNNYYTKDETYSQAQVDNLISQIEVGGYEEVSELPATGDPNVIYLVPKPGGGYDRWIYSNGEWKDLGGTDIDLSNYVRIDEIADMIHPVGDTVIRTDNINPGTLYTGTTWQLISQGRVLIGADSTYPLGSTGGNASHSHTNPTTNGSSAENTGKNNGNTGTPSTNTSGPVTLSAAQSGVPAHTHTQNAHVHNAETDASEPTRLLTIKKGTPTTSNIIFAASSSGRWRALCVPSDSSDAYYGSVNNVAQATATNNNNTAANASQAHSHTLSNHTHNLGDHAHSMAHTHTQGNTGSASNIPPHLAVNIWLRTA